MDAGDLSGIKNNLVVPANNREAVRGDWRPEKGALTLDKGREKAAGKERAENSEKV